MATRRMSRPLSDFETTPKPFEYDIIFSDMQRDVAKMKKDLGVLDVVIPGLAHFTDTNNLKKTQPVANPGGQLANVDVSAYRPDELSVRSVGPDTLEVVAEHREKNGLSESHRKLQRHFHVPPNVDINTIIPTLTPEGRLIIEAAREPQFNAM